MALIDCFECKAQVSDVAETCPHCGAPQPAKETALLGSPEKTASRIGVAVASVVLLVLALLIASHFFSAKEPTASEQAEALLTRLNENPVTRPKYDRIPTGAIVEEVNGIIGHSGEEVSRVEIGRVETVMYSWKNKNGSNMNATFQNGSLVSKAQFGLP